MKSKKITKSSLYGEKAKEFLNEYWIEHNHSPSIRELSKATGCRSTSHMVSVMEGLVESGEITVSSQTNTRGYIPNWVKKAIDEFRQNSPWVIYANIKEND